MVRLTAPSSRGGREHSKSAPRDNALRSESRRERERARPPRRRDSRTTGAATPLARRPTREIADSRSARGRAATKRSHAILERIALVPPAPGANVYHAFISYSHAGDGRLAPSLQKGLQRFAKPWYRARALRVFRDEASLSANPHLWASIEQALAASRHFILLASPEAAASPWVAREAEAWRQTKTTDTLLIGLTEGDLVWNETGRRLRLGANRRAPANARGAFSEEPRWIDLRWARDGDDLTLRNPQFRDAVAELAAPMHGRPKDELASEEVRQHRRTVRIVRSGDGGVRAADRSRRRRSRSSRSFSAAARSTSASSPCRASSPRNRSSARERSRAQPAPGDRIRRARHATESLAALRRSLSANHLRRTLPGTSVPLDAVAWSRDGRLVAAGDRGGDVRVWDARTASCSTCCESENWDIQSVAFDPSGTRLVAAPREGRAADLELRGQRHAGRPGGAGRLPGVPRGLEPGRAVRRDRRAP